MKVEKNKVQTLQMMSCCFFVHIKELTAIWTLRDCLVRPSMSASHMARRFQAAHQCVRPSSLEYSINSMVYARERTARPIATNALRNVFPDSVAADLSRSMNRTWMILLNSQPTQLLRALLATRRVASWSNLNPRSVMLHLHTNKIQNKRVQVSLLTIYS